MSKRCKHWCEDVSHCESWRHFAATDVTSPHVTPRIIMRLARASVAMGTHASRMWYFKRGYTIKQTLNAFCVLLLLLRFFRREADVDSWTRSYNQIVKCKTEWPNRHFGSGREPNFTSGTFIIPGRSFCPLWHFFYTTNCREESCSIWWYQLGKGEGRIHVYSIGYVQISMHYTTQHISLVHFQ